MVYVFIMSTRAYDNLPELTNSEKLMLVEQLWSDLAENAEVLVPPKWHEDVLKAREQEWEQRESLAEDWSTARSDLLNELK